MSDTLPIGTNVQTPTAGTATASSASANQARVRDLAAQFEGLLLSQMMRDLKSAMVDDGEDKDKQEGLDTSPLGDTVTADLGQALSRAGGFGLAQSLSSAIARQAGVSTGDVTGLTNGLTLPLALPVLPTPGPGGDGPGGPGSEDIASFEASETTVLDNGQLAQTGDGPLSATSVEPATLDDVLRSVGAGAQ